LLEYFYYCGSKTKEWDIGKFRALKYLHIHSNTTLENIEFLKELKNLETLYLLYCSNIKRFPDLSGLKKLNTITAYDCNRLEDITELKKLNNVEIHLNSKMLPEKFYHIHREK
jgi:Leucine-rich repeat (LRR) protein